VIEGICTVILFTPMIIRRSKAYPNLDVSPVAAYKFSNLGIH